MEFSSHEQKVVKLFAADQTKLLNTHTHSSNTLDASINYGGALRLQTLISKFLLTRANLSTKDCHQHPVSQMEANPS